MSKKPNQERGFTLEIGTVVLIPKDVYISVPRSNAKFGETLPLVGFLQEVALAPHERGRKKVSRRYEFATRDTGGKGLKCFLPHDAQGKTVQVVMIFINSNHPRRARSVAMVSSDDAEDFIVHYQRDETSLFQELNPSGLGAGYMG